MQTYRISTRLPQVSRVLRTTTTKPTAASYIPSRTMALWPRYVRDEFASFQPVFRFLDDYANHLTTGGAGATGREFPAAIRNSFSTKFDVIENENNYELHGELPGLEQKDVNIEFTDPQTLVIKGSSQQVREEGERSAGLVEGQGEQGKLTEGEAESKEKHQATVEDEQPAGQSTTEESTEVAQSQPEQQKGRYWVREMSRGEFSRTFAFPSRVDHDGVKASLKNGVLSVVVPKAPAPQARRINIE